MRDTPEVAVAVMRAADAVAWTRPNAVGATRFGDKLGLQLVPGDAVTVLETFGTGEASWSRSRRPGRPT